MIKHETEENVVAPNAIEAFFPPLAARTLLLKRLKTLNIPNQKQRRLHQVHPHQEQTKCTGLLSCGFFGEIS